MKKLLLFTTLLPILVSCGYERQKSTQMPIVGTWKLISGMTIKEQDTVIVDYTKGQEMLKIITPTHFSFLRHDLNHGKDSLAIFFAGGGRAKITENKYIEYLDFFNHRDWEGGQFELEYHISGDTLTTKGIEKVEKLGVNHLNIETFIRIN